MTNIINKLKTLKELRPDKEWSLLVMAEITKETSPQSTQLTLLQKVENFVSMHNNIFKTFVVSAVVTTAVLILGFGVFTQPEPQNFLLDNNTRAEINAILTETTRINSAIRVEIDEGRITEENDLLMALLDQRHEYRLKLQSIISKEIDNIKIRREEELTNQNIELLILAQKANDVENFHLALFVLENIRD